MLQISRKPGCFGPGESEGRGGGATGLPGVFQTQRWREVEECFTPKSCLLTGGWWLNSTFFGGVFIPKESRKMIQFDLRMFFQLVWKTANLVFSIFHAQNNPCANKLRSSFASPLNILRIWAEWQGSAEVFVAPSCGWHKSHEIFFFLRDNSCPETWKWKNSQRNEFMQLKIYPTHFGWFVAAPTGYRKSGYFQATPLTWPTEGCCRRRPCALFCPSIEPGNRNPQYWYKVGNQL